MLDANWIRIIGYLFRILGLCLNYVLFWWIDTLRLRHYSLCLILSSLCRRLVSICNGDLCHGISAIIFGSSDNSSCYPHEGNLSIKGAQTNYP